MKKINFLVLAVVFFIVVLDITDAWRGNYYSVRRSRRVRTTYCACWYFWWGCSYWRSYWRTQYYYEKICSPGWTHNGNQDCSIPVCRPSCQNGGKCTSPNYCDCPSTSSGPYTGCATLTCSYARPCYPGNCTSGTSCSCESGFSMDSVYDGCLRFDSSREDLRPVVGKSNVTLSHIRRTDGNVDFMFILEGLEMEEPGMVDIIWSNQKRFNNLRFEYVTFFTPPENLPKRPNYVSESEIGIVESIIEANVSKVDRDGSPIRDPGSFKVYTCESGFSKDVPEAELATCIIDDDQFRTLIEHGDWLNIKFKSSSGGFQQLVNIDKRSEPYAKKYFKGLQDIREVQFNFDFLAPKHCTETEPRTCNSASGMLRVENEFTKDPIKISWSGWTDELSGVLEYYIEVFKLSPDIFDKLIETEPLNPVYNITIQHSNIVSPKYTPNEPGMYSVLMETRDMANNSRIARRLVLFDDKSEIILNESPDGKLYVSSAVNETGYMWQTANKGDSVTIDIEWPNHFINEIIEDNKLLYPVDTYPIQFKDIEDDGVLYSKKFVQDSLDDHEGKRTLEPIKNFHGIVKFERAFVFTLDESEPSKWEDLTEFDEKTSQSLKLGGGSHVRIWVRATDVMGNKKADSTLVRFDGTDPLISKGGDEGHNFELNVESENFNFSSRVKFVASDRESGVHKIGFSITIKTTGKNDRVIYEGFAPAMTSDDLNIVFCQTIGDTCFIMKQELYLDNCWFLISKSDLDISTASVEVFAYNQALLNASTTFDVGPVNKLEGLEKYHGPENIRIESPTPHGFRVAWDLPEKKSCYEMADIVLVLLRKGAVEPIKTYYTSGSSRYFDILGLDAVTEYEINFGMKMPTIAAIQQSDVSLNVKTEAPAEPESATGLIIGVVVGMLVLVVAVVFVMMFLIRKGYLHPAERARSVQRAVTQKVRSTIPMAGGSGKVAYNKEDDDLYIYGGMDVQAPQIWHINRKDVTFETLIKTGNFANIYKARLKTGRSTGEVVVAKTLKEQSTPDDELLMRAKINFTGEKVGTHPNVLKFIGAVVNDDAMGPFIIYEYCENGTLRDYLAERKDNVTMELQDNLFRFGLDIAKGMEFLAGKGIVHRRLAARNILLNFLNEVKISGFGPQPSEEDGGDAEKGKKERIPVKWVAPECFESTRGATEKSDVWSFAVVLWEIFTLGETPYPGKGTDLRKRLKKGERLPKPEQCDDTWYALMRKCWSYDPSKRPKFKSVRQELDNLFVAAPGDDYYFYKR